MGCSRSYRVHSFPRNVCATVSRLSLSLPSSFSSPLSLSLSFPVFLCCSISLRALALPATFRLCQPVSVWLPPVKNISSLIFPLLFQVPIRRWNIIEADRRNYRKREETLAKCRRTKGPSYWYYERR